MNIHYVLSTGNRKANKKALSYLTETQSPSLITSFLLLMNTSHMLMMSAKVSPLTIP